MLDILIKGGQLATGSAVFKSDIGIKGGKIVVIGEAGFTGDASRTIDATGKVVIPGVIDPHVHYRGITSEIADGPEDASVSAAYGGITTFLVFSAAARVKDEQGTLVGYGWGDSFAEEEPAVGEGRTGDEDGAALAQAQGLEKLPGGVDNLGVKGRVVIPDCLIAELVMFSQPACLGPFISENRGEVIQLYRLRQVMQAVFQIGAAHRRGALRP